MDRREFISSSVVVSVASAIDTKAQPLEGVKPVVGERGAPGKKMNVLYVFSDQHRAVSLPGEPYSQTIAPALDAFRKANVSMDLCISNYPLCSPHRSILMSGKYPQETGVMMNGPALPTDLIGLGEVMRRAGYHTGYIGKWHLSGGAEKGFIPPGPRRFGFEDWHVWDNTNDHYHAPTYDPVTGAKIVLEGWQPTRMTDQALTFLGEQKADKPWFLIVSWNPPHPPFDPPEEDKAPYPAGSLTNRPNVHVAAPGEHLKGRLPLNSIEALHQAQQGYYGGITGVDKEFGRILKALDANGQAANTIVIYTSDHGEMMGSHGHMAKQMPHEESSRVPFFVRVPGAKPKAQASKVLFSTIDIYPSVCGLAGVAVPSQCRGRDLSAALRGDDVASQEHVFLLNTLKPDSPEQFTPTYRGIRTPTHTYAVTEEGRWLLYDNIADPYQMKNLVKDPEQAALIAKFDTAIEGWMAMTGDKFPYGKAIKGYAHFSDEPVPEGGVAA